MALYAFDGTWNKDLSGEEKCTNVVCFRDAYREKWEYWAGVGTRLGALGLLAGGITGAGGRQRIAEGLARLNGNWAAGETTIDIVGFSRGAALALHFANQVRKLPSSPQIRFLGLWDTVPSFGVPGNEQNLGWELALPDNVLNCFHALALDECRGNFPVHRLQAHPKGTLFEVWFRGVHSDIGGGNGNTGLASISLHWMLQNALRCQLPVAPEKVRQAAERRQPACPISIHRVDLIKQPFRRMWPLDIIHSSVVLCADADGRRHNNPPAGVNVVDDDCRFIAKFGAAAGGHA
jgi:uncharacterized protein (DUF2235 family)